MKILLVEDEKLVADSIISQLNDLGYSSVAHMDNSVSAQDYYTNHDIDLLIMDIGLAGSPIDGIELASQLMKICKTPLIFLSSYSDEHTLQRVQHVVHSSYLVKPCSSRQLFVSIEGAMSTHYDPSGATQLGKTNHQLYQGDAHFYVKKNTHYEKVSINDVVYVSSTRGGVVIHTVFGKYMLTASLASFERQLKHPSLLRLHKSYVVNKNHVVAIGDKEVIIILEGKEVVLPCGTTYIKDFRRSFFKLKSD